MATTKTGRKATTKKATTQKTTSKAVEVANAEPTTEQINDAAVAIREVQENGVTGYSEINLPDLNKQILVPIDLVSSYWSPETVGESRDLFYDCVRTQTIPDVFGPDPSVLRDVDYVFFFERDENGNARQICSGAARLVGFFQDRDIPRLSPFRITYDGKVKNKSNNFESQSFGIRMFAVKTAE